MIHSIWKPFYVKGSLSYYKLCEDENLNNLKGKTAYKVIWTCDNLECKNPSKLHSINASHLIKDKMSPDIQICRPCQCSGTGNGRFGDNRKWNEIIGDNRSKELKEEYRKRWLNLNNPSHLDDIKIKKKQTIINENTIPILLKGINFELVEIIELNGKKSRIKVKCDNGHTSDKVYCNLFRKTKKYRCEKCFYNDIKLDLSEEEIMEVKNYKKIIRSLTVKTYKKYKNIINPDNLEIGRGKYHIDHKFSIHEGFKCNVDVITMSSKENLQIISERENCSKQEKCSLTLDELFSLTRYLL